MTGIGLGLGLHLGRTGIAGASPYAPNNYVGMIGASSVAAGGDLDHLAALVSGTNVAGVQFWATMLSDGGLCWAGCSATGGYTVEQVYDEHWPIMRDATPKRGFVGFYAGTNDTDALAPSGTPSPAAIAARIAFVSDFIDEARANGQVPFVVAPQPNESSVEGIAAMPAWRLALIDLCAEKNAIFADVFAALGDPDTGLWLDDTYTEDGDPTSLHIGPIGGPLAGQAIADALMPHRNPNHNPRLVSAGDETDNWLWQGGRFANDGNANGRPDGGGTGLATDAWGAASNDAALSLEPGTGDIDGNWLVMTKTGSDTSSSASLTPTTAPGKVVFAEDDVLEVAYHMRDNVGSALAGIGLKLYTVASGSTYAFYHRTIRASATISDKIVWALHAAPASTDYRFTYGIDVTGAGDTGDVGIAMLSLSAGAWDGTPVDPGVPTGAVLNSDGGPVLNSSGSYIIGA